MRKLGLQTIKLVNLIRYFSFATGIKIFWNLLFAKNGKYKINCSYFKNQITLRKDQSDPYIFEQVFCENQYYFDYPNPDKIKWIIDAGANIGLAAIYFATKFPQATILSIEPDNNNFTLLQENTKNYKNIHCIHAALWHTEELLYIKNEQEKSAGFMVETLTQPTENSIKGVTINGLMKEYQIPSISILKIDIEGAEKEVFEFNNTPWIHSSDCIITELHDWLKPGISQIFFKEMARFDWITYVRGENILCLKPETRK